MHNLSGAACGEQPRPIDSRGSMLDPSSSITGTDESLSTITGERLDQVADIIVELDSSFRPPRIRLASISRASPSSPYNGEGGDARLKFAVTSV